MAFIGWSRRWRTNYSLLQNHDCTHPPATTAFVLSATIILRAGGKMANFEAVIQQLRAERNRTQSQLESLDQAISVLEGSGASSAQARPSGRRTMSAGGRRRIAEAQRRRWAKVKGTSAKPRKRTLSPAARRRIAAAQKARWAKFRAAKKH